MNDHDLFSEDDDYINDNKAIILSKSNNVFNLEEDNSLVAYDDTGKVIEKIYPFVLHGDRKKVGKFANRIVGYGEIRPNQLIGNPFNFRVHSAKQQGVVKGALETWGWINNIIVNIQTRHMVDGHLRAMLAEKAGESFVPAVYVDLTPEEEKKALLFFDQSGALATIDWEMLAELAQDLEIYNQELNDYMDELMDKANLANADIDGGNDEDMTGLEDEISFTISCTNRDLKDFQKLTKSWMQRSTVSIEYD